MSESLKAKEEVENVGVEEICPPTMREIIHLFKDDNQVISVESAREQILEARNNGNNYIDMVLSSGSASILPELILHAKSLNMKVCIIVDGNDSVANVKKMMASKVDDFLIGIGCEKEIPAKAVKLMDTISKEMRFRVLALVNQENYEGLANLATNLVNWEPTIVVFRNEFSSIDSDLPVPTIEMLRRTGADLDVAIDILEAKGIGVNIQNWPMCHIKPEHRRCISNPIHDPFDPYSYSYGRTPKTYNHYIECAMENATIECLTNPESVCNSCDIINCCGGIVRSILKPDDKTAVSLVSPIMDEPKQIFPFAYRRGNTLTMKNPYPDHLVCTPGVRGESSKEAGSYTLGFTSPTESSAKEVSEYAPVSAENLKAAGLPVDFGPRHPDWGIPSKMNRYKNAKAASLLK